jgi:hypothetical protein
VETKERWAAAVRPERKKNSEGFELFDLRLVESDEWQVRRGETPGLRTLGLSDQRLKHLKPKLGQITNLGLTEKFPRPGPMSY